MFCHLSPWEHHKCVLKPSEQGSFFQDDRFEGHMPRVYYNNECFPIYLLGICIMGVGNSQKRPCFSKMIDLRGHMPRFSWKMNIFPSICLETTWMGVGTLRTVLRFSKMIDLRGHIPRFTLKMNIFPSISWETP